MIKLALKELCLDYEIGKYGIPASAEEFDAKKVRYLRITDIDDFGNLLNNDKKSVSANDLDKYLLKEGDIVFARTGNSTGRTYYHEAKNGDLAFAGFLIKYGLDSKKINPKYLKYYTLSSEYKQWVKNLSVGSTRGNINAFTFANCPISVPERKQQNLLVNVLSALDYKIELNNQINAELEAMAKTLYDYWFVQFDFPFGSAQGKPFDSAPFDYDQGPASQHAPVAEQNSPVAERSRTVAERSHTVAERSRGYKSSGGKMVYNEVLKREIPEGWEVKKLEKVGNFKNGVNYDPSKPGNIPCPIINVRNISKSSFFIKNEDLDVIYLESSDVRKYSVNSDSIIIARSGIPGATRMISDFAPNTLYCGFAIHFDIIETEFKNFIFFYLKSLEEQIKNGSGGTILKNVNQGVLNGLRTSIPPLKVIHQFNKIINPILNRINNLEKQNQELAQLRDWLLPMLMNGQVTVGAVEEMGMVAEEKVGYQKS